MDYQEHCEKPIPIGNVRYAYQCENISMQPIHGAIDIRAYVPFNKGKEPYPNDEKDVIEHYDLKIERFTANSMTLSFIKKFKDGREKQYMTTVSFAGLVNTLFENNPANVWEREAPVKKFE